MTLNSMVKMAKKLLYITQHETICLWGSSDCSITKATPESSQLCESKDLSHFP